MFFKILKRLTLILGIFLYLKKKYTWDIFGPVNHPLSHQLSLSCYVFYVLSIAKIKRKKKSPKNFDSKRVKKHNVLIFVSFLQFKSADWFFQEFEWFPPDKG